MATTPQRALIRYRSAERLFPGRQVPAMEYRGRTRPGGVGHFARARAQGVPVNSGPAHCLRQQRCGAVFQCRDERLSAPARPYPRRRPECRGGHQGAGLTSVLNTALEQTLVAFGINELLICGMMTQNCVTHTAISKAGRKIPGCGARRLLCLGEPDHSIHRLEGAGRTRAGRGISKRPVAATPDSPKCPKNQGFVHDFPSSLYDWRFRKIAGFKEFSWLSTVPAVLPWSAAAFPSSTKRLFKGDGKTMFKTMYAAECHQRNRKAPGA